MANAAPILTEPTPSESATVSRVPACLIALSDDPQLLDALDHVSPDVAAVVPVTSSEQFIDAVLNHDGCVGLLDVAGLTDPIVTVLELRKRFPALVLIAAGSGHLQSPLAPLLTAGHVFRFLHKPASSQRLQLFIEAGLRRRQEVLEFERTQQLPILQPPLTPRRPWPLIGGAAAMALLVLLVAWEIGLHQHRPAPATTAARPPPVLSVKPAISTTTTALEPSDSESPSAASADGERLLMLQQRAAELSEQLRNAANSAKNERAQLLLQLARRRMASGALTEPIDDSASSYLKEARKLIPQDPALSELSRELSRRLAASRPQPAAVTTASGPESVDSAPATVPGDAAVQSTAVTADAASAANGASGETALQRDHFVAPRYPIKAQEAGVSGWVDVQFIVSATGSVKDAMAVDAQPRGTFDAAAIAAVAQWHYQPPLQNGRVIERRARVRLRFTLQH